MLIIVHESKVIMARKPKDSPSSLENNLAELKKIVAKMEEKNLPLEESLMLFESGIQHVRTIQAILTNAEQKIMILLKQKNEDPELKAFEE